MASNLVSATKGQIQYLNKKHCKLLVESTDSAFCLMKKHQNRRTICPQLSQEQELERVGEWGEKLEVVTIGLWVIAQNLTWELDL